MLWGTCRRRVRFGKLASQACHTRAEISPQSEPRRGAAVRALHTSPATTIKLTVRGGAGSLRTSQTRLSLGASLERLD